MTDEKFKDVFEKMKALPDVFGIAYVDGVFLIAMEGADERFQEADFEGCRARLISYFHFRLLDDQLKLWEAGPAAKKSPGQPQEAAPAWTPSQELAHNELQQLLPPGAEIVSVEGDKVTYRLTLPTPLPSVDLHIPEVQLFLAGERCDECGHPDDHHDDCPLEPGRTKRVR